MKFKNFYNDKLTEGWDIVSTVKNFPIRVSISDVDLITTGHGDDQRTRHGGGGGDVVCGT
jgi:hypothetical protein